MDITPPSTKTDPFTSVFVFVTMLLMLIVVVMGIFQVGMALLALPG